eukprot:Pgem_evm1s6205
MACQGLLCTEDNVSTHTHDGVTFNFCYSCYSLYLYNQEKRNRTVKREENQHDFLLVPLSTKTDYKVGEMLNKSTKTDNEVGEMLNKSTKTDNKVGEN